MANLYLNIADFLSCRTSCFFCDKPLDHRITHFLGSFNEMPVISVSVKDSVATFPFRHTTPNFDLQVEGKIDIRNNILTFTNAQSDDTPNVDRALAKNVFLEMMPCAQLRCECKYRYTVVSDVFKIMRGNPDYVIEPVKFFYESFVFGNLWVQNDYIQGKTCIYTRDKENAIPITCPLIDWKAMGHKKLLTRIKTLVVFS